MKNLSLLFTIFFASLMVLNAQDQNTEKDVELIKEVIQKAYVDGLCNNADEEAVNEGFHPGFALISSGQNGTLYKTPMYNWITYAQQGKEKGNKYSFQNELTTVKYQFVDVTGNAAVAKIDFYEGDVLKFVDYLSLLKFDDKWKIVSKTYYAIPQDEEKSE